MRKFFSLFAFVCLSLGIALTARAQNLTTVSASNIQDINGSKLAAGQLCFQATDQSDQIISFQIGGGGQALRRQYCSPVTNGVATSFTVPNPANTQPSGTVYRVTIRDSSTGLEVLRYTQVAFTGATFNFDNFAPALPTFTGAASNTTVGNLNITGALSATGSMSFTPSAFTAANAIMNQGANGNDAIFGKRATDTSPTGNFLRFRNFANSADLWTVDVTGTLQAGSVPVARLSGIISAAQLPAPTASTLGGVQSFTALSHQWINSISTSGAAAASQPSFADISGTAIPAQLPNPSASTLGGVQSFTAPSHQWISSISTSGVPAGSQPSFADISGTTIPAQLPNPSSSTLGGVQSFAAVSHQWINSISTVGVLATSQPAAADLSNGTTGSGTTLLASSPILVTPNLGAVTGTTHTFVNQVAPATPSVGSIVLYGDSGTGNITCHNSSGGNCLIATASAPFTSASASPATTGVLRVSTGDTAIAFRNNANSADIAALTKTTSDVITVGGSAGITTPGPLTIGATDAGFSRTAAAILAVGNGTAGDSSGTLKALSITSNTHAFVNQAAPANPSAGNIVLYGDSSTGNLTCRTTSGGSCFTASTTAPFISGSANPAATGILRVASGDSAVVFRNNAGASDVIALSKTTSDQVSIGGNAGVAITGATSIAETAAPSGAASLDVLWSDSSAHRLRMNNNNAGTDSVAGAATTDTFTNKSIDAEASGNSITQPMKIWYQAGGCQNSAFTGYWDLGATSIPAAVCVAGANVVKGLLRYTANGQTAQFHYQMPSDTKTSGSMDINLLWTTGTASGTVQWAVDATCTSIGFTDDPAWSALWTPAISTASATVNAMNLVSITGLTAPCSAGQIMHLRLKRVDTTGTATNADVYGAEITFRRTQ